SGSVSNQLSCLCLRIVTPARIRFSHFKVTPSIMPPVFPHRMGAPRSPLGEFRILVDFQPPTCPIREVPMERVELIQRHQVNELLQKRKRIKVPGNIEMEPPVTEPRLIFNNHSRQSPSIGLGVCQLKYC